MINLHFSLLTAPCILLAPRLTLTFENKNKTHNAKRRAKRAQTTLSYIKMTFHSFSFRAIFLLAIAVVVVVLLLVPGCGLHFHRIGQRFSRFSRVFFILYAFCVNFWKFYMIICWVKQYLIHSHARTYTISNLAHTKHTHTRTGKQHSSTCFCCCCCLLLLPALLLLLLLLLLILLFLCFGTNSFIHFHYTRPRCDKQCRYFSITAFF